MKKGLYITSILTVIAFLGLQAQKPAVREVSSEASVAKGSLVRIVGANRKLNIKSWDQAKVKVTVQVMNDSSMKSSSNDELFEALGVSIKPFSNRVDIMANRSTGYALTTTSLSPITVTGYPKKKTPQATAEQRAQMTYAEDVLAATTLQGQRIYNSPSGVYYPANTMMPSMNNILSLEIMVPAGSKLDIDNQYGDVVIGMSVDDAKLDISNGALDMQDVKNLELTGKYCNANFGNIEKAEVEFQNGTFHAQNVSDLDLDSKYSTIEYEKGKDLYLRSQADNITIDEISKVEGRKTYGSIRVDMLNGGFDLEGTNVDIKVKNINPQVELIKISNKYGDVRLPVKNLKNYFVDFTGFYSTVFTPFPKTIVKEEEKKQADTKLDKEKSVEEIESMAMAGEYFRTAATLAGELAPKRFTGSVGDVSGKHTRFQLTCHSCTVDFK